MQRTLLIAVALLLSACGAFAEVPQGKLTHHSFSASKVFPGTVRNYSLYVPAQYDGSKPACVYICQDGVMFDAPAVFDKLIAAGEMPVTIGLFVGHGRVPASAEPAVDRFNRSFEYDGLGPNYANFLLDELLPHVEAEHNVKLSKDGNDRLIAGVSSGAIAAFTAAWERPDAFSRVYSGIGTYVGLRGGHVYPTLIRKYEPKPLRLFLQAGRNDLNIYGGDWWVANLAMDRSLRFAGYEVHSEYGDGGHNVEHATKLFPQAMRYLWKGWPARVKAGAGSPQLQAILADGGAWEKVFEGARFTEGPAASPSGELFFNDVFGHKTYRVGLDGQVSLFAEDNGQGDGQAFGPDGRLYSVAGAKSQILAWDASGRSEKFAEGFRGNDMVVRHDGGMYVTNPGWDGRSQSRIWFVSAQGKATVVDEGGYGFANGITLSPDQTLLLVADTRSHWVYSYSVQADGSLKHKQKFYHLHAPDTADQASADGLCMDADGRLYVATALGIQVCDQAGRVNAIIPSPIGHISNLTIAGKDFDTLYATCRGEVWRRKLKVRGVSGFMEPEQPPKPRL